MQHNVPPEILLHEFAKIMFNNVNPIYVYHFAFVQVWLSASSKLLKTVFFHISTNVIIRWQKLSNERDNIVDVKNIYEMKRFSIVNYSCKIKSTKLRVGENLAYVILKKCAKFRR